MPPAPLLWLKPGGGGTVSKLPAGERRALRCLLRRSHQPRAEEQNEDGRPQITKAEARGRAGEGDGAEGRSRGRESGLWREDAAGLPSDSHIGLGNRRDEEETHGEGSAEEGGGGLGPDGGGRAAP